MAIVFRCKCGREIRVKDALAGKKGKCPECGAVVQVPTLEEAAATPPPQQTPAAPEAPVPEAPTDAPTEETTQRTKPCVHCGKHIPVEAVFCTHCGTHLRTGKKHGGENVAQEEEEYDFIKVAPDMLTAPVSTVHTLCESSVSSGNLKKAIIFFAVGWLVMVLVCPKIASQITIDHGLKGSGQGSLSLWHYFLFAFIALVVVVTDLIITNVAGTMFGSPGVGMPNVFVSILAAHALVGLSMIIPVLFLFSFPSYTVITWVTFVLRMGGGVYLLYGVIQGAYDTGTVPAGLFAGAAAIVRGLLFWLASAITGTWLI